MKYVALLLSLFLCSCAAVTGIGNPSVTFYGRAIDETGKPISDAEVYVRVMTSILQVDSGGGSEYKLKTDQNGRFRFSKSGLSVQVEVGKSGYGGESLGRSAVVLSYDSHKKEWSPKTSESDPYVFRLVQKQKG
jgi:hypothetical protein